MLLSIITVNLNNANGLERTMRSVLSQTAKEIEYIVIDGASSDGSRDLIETHASRLAFYISEPDTGIYCAMNKGIRNAHGDYCLFLNSGDWLVSDDVISRVLGGLEGACDIYYSDLYVSDCERHHEIRYPATLDANYFVSETISHQNCLIRTELLRATGMYREDFRIAADWFFFLEASYRHRASFKHIDTNIAYYYFMGRSTSPEFEQIKKREHELGLRELFGEMAPSILALNDYRQSLYGSTLRIYGDSEVLHWVLRGYRFLAKCFPRLRTKKSQ